MNNVANEKSFLKKRLPLSVGIIAIIIFGVAGIYLSGTKEPKPVKDTTTVVTKSNSDEIEVRRQKGFELVQPLLITEVKEQAPNLFHVRDKIQAYVDSNKSHGFSDASVHLLKQNSGEWIGVNQERKYSSKGYLRNAVMITLLKMSESNNGLLNHQVVFTKREGAPIYPLLSLTSGKSYTIKQLIEQMMLTPDTTPKSLLIQYVDKSVITSMYEQLGLGHPDFEMKKFEITAAGYSKFLNVLFNGRYLSEANSEYALKLLSNNTEREGLLKFLPEQSKVVHKLIQRYNNKEFEVRESGIIYCNNETYLLTIFITGKDTKKLDAACGEIGKRVYDEVSME